jgi:alpha/beta hydrolase fold
MRLRSGRGWRAVTLVACLCGLAVAACSPTTAGSGLSAQSPVPSTPASPASAAASAEAPVPVGSSRPPAGADAADFVAVVSSAGVRQWLQCSGAGPLTLVVVPGLSTAATAWSGVLPALRRLVRTCVYDRPGLGLSPPRPNRAEVVDTELLGQELWSALRAAGQRGPYLVLGHSFGGLVARAFVAAHRSSVRGLLLAESVTPGDPSNGRFWREAGHWVDLAATATAARSWPRLGGLPLLVLSASRPDENHLGGPTYHQPAWVTALWVREQQAQAALSNDEIQVVAQSGHVLQQDNPAAVIEAVRVLVTSVRDNRSLSCEGSWAQLEATCA